MTKCPNVDNTPSGTSLLDRVRNSLPDYYSPDLSLEHQAAVLGVTPERLSMAGPAERSTIYMVALWAMRVGEWLHVTAADIRDNDMVFIHGEKGSASFLLQAPGICQQFAEARISCPGRLVAGTNYQRVYRACIRMDLGIFVPGHVNASRTHAARYKLASEIVKRGNRAASDCLRHRSDSSLPHYTGA